MFDWTTLYKLNHDEYEESEETTFSYPAKILPPSPQNIAKSIVIIPDLKIEMTANDVSLIDTSSVSYKPNFNVWLTNNSNKLGNYEVDLKSLLDPTLLINTFNDLKRYYKSITIYYDYVIETKEEIKNSHDNKLVVYSTNETFRPAKSENISKTIDLKDLILSNHNPTINEYKQEFLHPNDNNDENGLAYIYTYSNNNSMPYNLIGYEFNLSVHFGSLGRTVNKNYETNSCIALSIVDNKHLKWNFYLQANLGKIECINDWKNNLIYTHGKRYISNIKTNIYKIILNSR
ncbi:hypothetical protein [Spiroplasma endosymbiont of Amphimallon solstitiale]|uniref:hypothetical protein n=1 Tax=Spiroplasma endosymbiont of Amphimallon solstitiale TaxID=3066288 RepID=UPI00313D7CFB